MTPIEKLTAILNARGLDVTPSQAKGIAVRSAGSVEAYLEMLAQNDKDLAKLIEPPPGPVSEKFSAPLAYTVNPPTGVEPPPRVEPRSSPGSRRRCAPHDPAPRE
jgi:hypothetical protein